ncbi:MAG: AbrB/MazE/SpoVT family DNA-binding domain-containing protein [Patescibacteria group bacterium]
MESAVVTTKGQVVIPSRLRRRHGIKKGTQVCFIERADEIVLRPVTDEYIDSLRGSLKTGGKILRSLVEDRKRERDR